MVNLSYGAGGVIFGRRHCWVSVTMAVDVLVSMAAAPWPAVQAGTYWAAGAFAGYLLLDLGWQAAKSALRWIRQADVIVIRLPRSPDIE